MKPRPVIKNSSDLQARIRQLKTEADAQESNIKHNYSELKTALKPQNVLKNTFHFIAETPEVQKTLITTAIGVMIGYGSKRVVKILNEENLNQTMEDLVHNQLAKLENKSGFLSQAVSLIRRFTPPTSAIYPFVKYR